MSIPSSGPISLLDIQSNAGGTDPISITEYYKGGTYIDATWVAPNVPTSGEISIGNFYGAFPDVIGQAEYTTVGTYYWVCPANVNSVSVVCVGAGAGGNYSPAAGSSSFSGAAGTLTGGGASAQVGGSGTAFGTLSIGTVGGGNGGTGGYSGGANAGGGGAGGYQGNGGNGARDIYGLGGGGGVGIYGGTGGGGGGGYYTATYQAPIRGAGAAGGEGGGNTSTGGIFGGGAGHSDGGYEYGGGGGGLRYVTAYQTVAGNTYTIVVGASNDTGAARGAVRIIWGSGRAYPATDTADK